MTDPSQLFYGAHEGGADYEFVVRSRARIFKEQGVVPPPDSFVRQLPVPIRPVGLIFGRPACKIFREELLPDRNYYNLRSGTTLSCCFGR
jgi:hypothetical protein